MPPKEQNKLNAKRARESSLTDSEVDDSRILEKLTRIQERIESGFTKIDDDIVTLKQELKNDIRVVQKEVKDVSTSLEAAWVEVNLLKENNNSLKKHLNDTLNKNCKLSEEIDVLRGRLIKPEDYSRRENLRFYNIAEEPGETSKECFAKVKEVLDEIGASSDEIRFHAIHRIGKSKVHSNNRPSSTASLDGASNTEASPRSEVDESQSTRPRPVIARFVSQMDAEWVWERRKRLMESQFSSVFIDKDLSAESAKDRGKLRAAYRKAKEANIERVFIRGNKLIVNSSSYSVNTLPEYLLPANKDTEKPG